MANIYEPSKEQIKEWEKWVDSRPEKVGAIARTLKPWELYRMKSTGHRVILYSIMEDETVTVIVSKEYNSLLFERRVFGISPDDLEPCDIPTNEDVGALLSQEEVEENIDTLRVAVRPDLWEMNDKGQAVKK